MGPDFLPQGLGSGRTIEQPQILWVPLTSTDLGGVTGEVYNQHVMPPRAGARDLLVPEVVPHLGLPVRALGDSKLARPDSGPLGLANEPLDKLMRPNYA